MTKISQNFNFPHFPLFGSFTQLRISWHLYHQRVLSPVKIQKKFLPSKLTKLQSLYSYILDTLLLKYKPMAQTWNRCTLNQIPNIKLKSSLRTETQHETKSQHICITQPKNNKNQPSSKYPAHLKAISAGQQVKPSSIDDWVDLKV